MPTDASIVGTFGHLHSLFSLLPMLLFTAALICDLANSFGKKRAFVVGHWMIIAGVITCMPVIFSGLEAAVDFGADNALLTTHHRLGIATAISASAYAGLRISAMIWDLPISKNFYLAMSIILVALISWTSDYGVLLSSS